VTALDDLYPDGAKPFHRDLQLVAAAAGVTDLVTPQASQRVLVASAVVSSTTAQRVAIVDGEDLDDRRVVDADLPVNGSLPVHLIPAYHGKQPGVPLRVINAAAGTIRVQIRGWIVGEG
jgi:hypothetical protein